MAEQQTSKVKKGAKKAFFEVRAPMTMSKIQLYASSSDELVGRNIKLDLTRSLKGKNFELIMKVKKENELLEGEPISLQLVGAYIRRMMRTGADYVEDSFEAECTNKLTRIKPFVITRNKVSRAVRRELRNVAREFLISYLKTRNTGDIFSELMANKLQKELFVKLKKIYPLALCEIRIFEIIGEKKAEAKKIEKEGEAVKMEEKIKEEKAEKKEEKAEKKEEKAEKNKKEKSEKKE